MGQEICRKCEVSGRIPCPKCEGSGEGSSQMPIARIQGIPNPCTRCEGEGTIECPICQGEGYLIFGRPTYP